MNKFSLSLLTVVAVVFLSSCGKGDNPNISPTTGWEYNNPDNGGFEVNIGAEQITGPGLVLIEGGTFTMGRIQEDVFYDWNNAIRRVTVSSFYMDETEIRNIDYRMYLWWLKRVYTDYPEVAMRALPDTLVWRSPLAYNEPYVQYYFRHPSYNEYPVVGVNWLQANDYAAWRSDRVNEQMLIDEGILSYDPNQINENNFNSEAYLAGQYEGVVNQNLPSLDPNKEERRVMLEDGIMLPRYRLPTEAEWEFAAYALRGNTFEERIFERRIYPWDGDILRNSNQKNRGEFMANFIRGRGDNMGVAGALNDNGAVTVDVKSYWPNDYGLYCMAGNVNEWVQDVYRPLSAEDVDGFNPFRGNVYTDLSRDANGNVLTKDNLGRMRVDTVRDIDVANRYNYQKADYRNYRDGDYLSTIVESGDWQSDNNEGTKKMYVQDDSGFSSLIDDKSRVIKGGSWKDRAYWLNPSTRRYLDQEAARDDVGFRCAMIRVGSPSGF